MNFTLILLLLLDAGAFFSFKKNWKVNEFIGVYTVHCTRNSGYHSSRFPHLHSVFVCFGGWDGVKFLISFPFELLRILLIQNNFFFTSFHFYQIPENVYYFMAI